MRNKMAELRIVGVPPELIHRLDELTAETKSRDRSAFVVAALQEYCLYRDRVFLHLLPATTRILSEDAQQKESKTLRDLLELTLAEIHAATASRKQFYDLFADDIDHAKEPIEEESENPRGV